MLSKLLQQAAGNTGTEALYVEDVFSTYLYTGNGSTQTIPNGIALGDKFVGTSTYFNGSAYLSRSSDLSGNSDGKTFTFSAWVYATKLTGGFYVYRSGTGSQFYITVADDGRVTIRGFDNIDNSSRLNVELPVNTVVANQWTNILISFDLSDTASRYVYVNDVAVTPTYFTYQNYNLDFTNSSHFIAAGSASSGKLTGYVTNIFLDYTYRDLSVTANRRYFIDANQCSTPSSTLSALNPILYLPLTSSTTLNAGTGGNFTANSSPVIEDIGTDFSAGYGEGGLVWIKCRSIAYGNALYDTARGAMEELDSGASTQESPQSDGVTGFNGSGFGVGSRIRVNTSGESIASWTFRKAEKFFDVVTYTGTGSNRTVAHNLGSVPGCIMVKRTDTSGSWFVYHQSRGATKATVLNSTASEYTLSTVWNDTAPTSSSFTVGTNTQVNAAGGTYVAYLFAHNAGGFGDDGTENVISCGSYTGNGSSTGPVIDLGWEPQWLLVKSSTATESWYVINTMSSSSLRPNATSSETTAFSLNAGSYIGATSTGFNLTNWTDPSLNGSGQTYIYIAIRRGPMKTPTSGTEVFQPLTNQPISGGLWDHNILTDFSFYHWQNGTQNWGVQDRLRGAPDLSFNSTSAESALIGGNSWDVMTGYKNSNPGAGAYTSWAFRRAPGFFDVVCYTGAGSTKYIREHNLGVVPELIIIKSRSNGTNVNYWPVKVKSIIGQRALALNSTNPDPISATYWPSQNDTATTFRVLASSTAYDCNATGYTYVAYLFATCPGVSKVGSYTGTGTTLQINCGFSGGARFVLIKRTDSTGDWYVWDSARGIVAGNDPYILLNSGATSVTGTDYIDPYSAGFEISSTAPAAINANGGSFIYLAIA